MNSRRITDSVSAKTVRKLEEFSPVTTEREILGEVSFQETIARERRRTDRSNRPFLLLLLDLPNQISSQPNGQMLNEMLSALIVSIRETDVIGWYWENTVIGVVFTEVAADEGRSSLSTMIARVCEILRGTLDMQQFSQIGMSFHLYPECSNEGAKNSLGNAMLYPDLFRREQHQEHLRAAKRAIDIVGSSAALLLLSPVLAVTALLVKLSSKGPVIYRQGRLGQFGQVFEFLKFRSMRVDSDPNIHQEFMKNVIAGNHDGRSTDSDKPVYKMTNDQRITPIGRFLRRSSLDELPQLFNVLKGEMSLVGPRPPLMYEYQEYQLWHRRRVLEVQPGITGLWQVQGRSRISFNDMVRLDLRYVRTWSLWLDLWIMLKTPGAVLLGDDAF
jgi:lipopolysaccharide/colanic/teichoic acid biosynthesis glycosyltransferase